MCLSWGEQLGTSLRPIHGNQTEKQHLHTRLTKVNHVRSIHIVQTSRNQSHDLLTLHVSLGFHGNFSVLIEKFPIEKRPKIPKPSLQWSCWPLIVWLSSELFDLARRLWKIGKLWKKTGELHGYKKKLRKIWKTPKTLHGVDVFPTYLTCQTEILVDMCHVYHLPLRCPPLQIWGVKTPSFSYRENRWDVEKMNYMKKITQVSPLTAWWCNNHLEKYESQWVSDDIPYMKWKKNVPNQQPVNVWKLICDQWPISTNFGVQKPLSFHCCWWESPCF